MIFHFFLKDSEGPGVALGSKLGLKIVLARHLRASWRLLEALGGILEPLGASWRLLDASCRLLEPFGWLTPGGPRHPKLRQHGPVLVKSQFGGALVTVQMDMEHDNILHTAYMKHTTYSIQ